MNNLIKLGKKLFPLNRSLTGIDNLKTLNILKNNTSRLKIKKFKSGKKVYDWKIPDEWNVLEAYVKDKYGNKIINFKKNNLHLVGYSKPFKRRVKKKEFFNHLHSLKSLPNAIPYVTSYYNKYWGFCISHNKKKLFDKIYKDNDKFDIVIDVKFKKKGDMYYGETFLPGKSKKEILISTYICHPSMVNNELSGPLVAVALINFFKKKKLKRSLRFIFVPETIGSIAYINHNLKRLKKNVIGGYVLTCIGDNRNYSIIKTKYENSLSDIAAKKAFIDLKIKYKSYSFLERCSDERQYNSPGVDLKIATLMRSKPGTYKEYHTSLDDFKLVTKSGLTGGFKIAKTAIQNLLNLNTLKIEKKRLTNGIKPKCKFICEPNLGKRGLYNLLGIRLVGNSASKTKSRKLLDFLQYSDGFNNLQEISKYIKLNIKKTKSTFKILKKNNLISI